MAVTLSTILSPLSRESVERERDRLREQLEDYEALLRLIDRHGVGSDVPPVAVDPVPENGSTTAPNGNGHGHTTLAEKRRAVLALMRERPGRWTTADVRTALAERGIDTTTGTPVKNILWQLAKSGEVSAAGSGVYEFPTLTTSVDDPRVKEAMAA